MYVIKYLLEDRLGYGVNRPAAAYRIHCDVSYTLMPKKENRGKSDFYDAVAYAQSEAGKAIEKLVPIWEEMYWGIKE